MLLVLILGAIWRAFNHVVKTAIPQHLETIQDGYEKMAASHERQVANLASTFQEERKIEREVVKETTLAIRELTEELRENHFKR